MRVVGRVGEVEKLNRQALRIAREVADHTGTLMAGNLCNTSQYDPNDPKTHEETRKSFDVRLMHSKCSKSNSGNGRVGDRGALRYVYRRDFL